MTLFGDNTNTTRTYGWQPEPPSRGTWSVLSSCVATMTLCIWTSLHLNMPKKGEGFLATFMRKTGWLICGLFAPELVVWTAFRQLSDAKNLTKKMNTLLAPDTDTGKASVPHGFWARLFTRKAVDGSTATADIDVEEPPLAEATPKLESRRRRRHPWTVIHSHYVLMGGFAFEASSLSPNVLPCNLPRLSLTPGGVVFLATANPDAVPDIAAEEINDKSKANGLAKTIVCLQALWFCIQCLARMGQGMGVSLLELNTFAHAICALLIFLLWWDKPLDIEEPTEIQSSDAAELAAACIVIDLLGVRHKDNFPVDKKHSQAQAEEGFLRKRNKRSAYLVQSSSKGGGLPPKTDTSKPDSPGHGILSEAELESLMGPRVTTRDLLPKGYGVNRSGPPELKPIGQVIQNDTSFAELYFTIEGADRAHLMLNATEVSCLRLGSAGTERLQEAANAAKDYQTQLAGKVRKNKRDRWKGEWTDDGARNLLCGRVSEWPALGWADQDGVHLNRGSLLVGFTIAGLVYGGMHMLAWTAPFQSVAEQVLWRGSSIVLLLSGLLLLLSQPFFAWCDSFEEFSRPFLPLMLGAFMYALLMLLVVFYVLARVCLVVECFLELQHMPAQVFETPRWTSYWPHIT